MNIPVQGTEVFINGQPLKRVVHFKQDCWDKWTLQVLHSKEQQEWLPEIYNLEFHFPDGEVRKFDIKIFRCIPEVICDDLLRINYLVTIL